METPRKEMKIQPLDSLPEPVEGYLASKNVWPLIKKIITD